MASKVVKLTFETPVHFGRRRLTDSEYTCDAATIFSALYMEALNMGCADELLQAARSGEFTISDAFPYIEDTLYIPKPMLAIASGNNMLQSVKQEDSRSRKASKKLKFIPASKFESFIAGSFDFLAEVEKFKLGTSSLHTKVNLTYENSNDAQPYHVGAYSFNKACGVYFVVDGSYDAKPLFEQLAYSGLGGKRTSGYGRFLYEIIDNAPFKLLRDNTNNKKLMLLSSAIPTEDELTQNLIDSAKYHLQRKSGFVQSVNHATSPQKKRDMYTFAPGSIFNKAFDGGIFDVNMSGEHPVYRYAKAMWMEV